MKHHRLNDIVKQMFKEKIMKYPIGEPEVFGIGAYRFVVKSKAELIYTLLAYNNDDNEEPIFYNELKNMYNREITEQELIDKDWLPDDLMKLYVEEKFTDGNFEEFLENDIIIHSNDFNISLTSLFYDYMELKDRVKELEKANGVSPSIVYRESWIPNK